MNKTVRQDIDFYMRVKSRRVSYDKTAQEWYEFAIMNKMWTTEEEQELKHRGQAPLVINRIKPVLRLYQAYLGGKTPRIRTIPTRSDIGEVSAEKISQVFNVIFAWIWYISDGDQQIMDIIEDFLVRGVGYGFVSYDKYARDGEGAIIFQRLHPNEVYVDLDVRKKDFQDASKIIISRMVSLNSIKLKLPEYKNKLQKAVGRWSTYDDYVTTDLTSSDDIAYANEIYDEEQDKVRIFDVYEKRLVTVYDVVSPQYGWYKQLEEDEYEIFKSTGIDHEMKKQYMPRVFRRFIVGDILIGEERLPTAYYPIVPFIFQFLENSASFGSLIMYIKDLNKEINKRRSLMIAHATTGAGSPKVFAQEGMFADKEQAEVDYARPSAIIETLDDPRKLLIVEGHPLPTALVQLEQFAKGDLEYVAGAPTPSMGFAQGSHDTFKGVLALDEFAKRNMAPVEKTFFLAMRRVGKVIVDFIQGYMKQRQLVRIVQPYDTPSEAFKSIEINVPIYDDKTGVLKTIENDVTIGKYDIEVVAQTGVSNQAVLLDMMLQYYQLGLIDDIEVYKHINIFDKEGLIQRKSLIMQQQNIISQMQSQIEELENIAENLDKELKNAKLKAEILNFKKHMNDVKLRAKASQLDLETQMKRAINELKLREKENAQNAKTIPERTS